MIIVSLNTLYDHEYLPCFILNSLSLCIVLIMIDPSVNYHPRSNFGNSALQVRDTRYNLKYIETKVRVKLSPSSPLSLPSPSPSLPAPFIYIFWKVRREISPTFILLSILFLLDATFYVFLSFLSQFSHGLCYHVKKENWWDKGKKERWHLGRERGKKEGCLGGRE